MRHGGYTFSDMDIVISYIRHVTLRKIKNSDMQHCHFLQSTCDIGDPPHQGPLEGGHSVARGWRGRVNGEGQRSYQGSGT